MTYDMWGCKASVFIWRTSEFEQKFSCLADFKIFDPKNYSSSRILAAGLCQKTPVVPLLSVIFCAHWWYVGYRIHRAAEESSSKIRPLEYSQLYLRCPLYSVRVDDVRNTGLPILKENITPPTFSGKFCGVCHTLSRSVVRQNHTWLTAELCTSRRHNRDCSDTPSGSAVLSIHITSIAYQERQLFWWWLTFLGGFVVNGNPPGD